jgi:transcriptional regulator with XRE-family HTH domain
MRADNNPTVLLLARGDSQEATVRPRRKRATVYPVATGDPEVGERIRAAREALGKSQEQVAAELGVSQGTVAKWEKGTIAVRQRHLATLSKTLGIDINSVLHGQRTGLAREYQRVVEHLAHSIPKRVWRVLRELPEAEQRKLLDDWSALAEARAKSIKRGKNPVQRNHR